MGIKSGFQGRLSPENMSFSIVISKKSFLWEKRIDLKKNNLRGEKLFPIEIFKKDFLWENYRKSARARAATAS